MAEILTDGEVNNLQEREFVFTDKIGNQCVILSVKEHDDLIASHRALAAERDKLRDGLDEEGLSLSERCCGSVKGALQERIRTFESACEAALKELKWSPYETEKFNERQRVIEQLEGAIKQ